MKKILYILLVISTISCTDSKWNGEWGATVGDCDEICTIYYSAQQEIMKNKELYDRDFPNKTERRKHVSKTEKGHRIESWYRVIDGIDTSKNDFSCELIYDSEKIGYLVKNLRIKKLDLTIPSNKNLEKDTVTIELEYYGWGCPCPQWITMDNKVLYESKSKEQKDKKLDLFWNVKPATDSLPNPFDLTDDMENLRFEFTGQFYVDPQFLGDEGEQGPAKTLLYYSVKHLN